MHPSIFKPFTRKLNIVIDIGRSSDLLSIHRLPIAMDSGLEDEYIAELTATGIVPDFHRASLFIPNNRKPTHLQI
jgi:hypothetical protein